jgi:hypothetical protein
LLERFFYCDARSDESAGRCPEPFENATPATP